MIVAGAKVQRANARDHVKNTVHDINNLLAVIDSGLRLLGRQNDLGSETWLWAGCGEPSRAAVLSRGLLDTAWRR